MLALLELASTLDLALWLPVQKAQSQSSVTDLHSRSKLPMGRSLTFLMDWKCLSAFSSHRAIILSNFFFICPSPEQTTRHQALQLDKHGPEMSRRNMESHGLARAGVVKTYLALGRLQALIPLALEAL